MTICSTGYWCGWSAAVLLAAVACGGGTKSDSGASTETDPIAFEQLGEELAEAWCTALDNCSSSSTVLSFYYGDQCEQYMRITFEERTVPMYQPLIEQGRIIYDPAQARECLNLYRTSDCGILESEAEDACLRVFQGTVATDATCSLDEECAGDAFCRMDAACPGVCAALSVVGGFCDYDSHCQDGLVCSWETSQCVQPSAAGGPCTDDVECQSGLVCSSTVNQCVAPQPAGAECNYSDLRCGEGFSCEPNEADLSAPSTCVAEPPDLTGTIVGAGETCDVFDGPTCADGLRCVFQVDEFSPGICSDSAASAGGSCQASLPTQCPVGYYCDAAASAGQLEGICQPNPRAGDPCAVTASLAPSCPPEATCIDSVCVALQRVGGPCQDDEECYTYACDNGVCSADPCASYEPSTTE